MRARFSAPIQTDPRGPTQPSIQLVLCLSRRPRGRGVKLTVYPPSSPEIKERIKLYISYPTGFSALFQGELYPYILWRVLPLHPVSSDQDHFLMFSPKPLREMLRLEKKSGLWTKVTILKQSLMHFHNKKKLSIRYFAFRRHLHQRCCQFVHPFLNPRPTQLHQVNTRTLLTSRPCSKWRVYVVSVWCVVSGWGSWRRRPWFMSRFSLVIHLDRPSKHV